MNKERYFVWKNYDALEELVEAGPSTATIVEKSITANGTYNASSDEADGYNPVVVNVANSYAAGDEGKVVDNGALVAQTARTVTTNNTTYDTTTNNSITVDIAIPQPTLITKSITTNGTYNASSDNADGYSSVDVAVPNTYTSGDDGKVVSNGALTSQTSTTKTSNGTYDTTLNNEVVIAVPNTYTQSDEGKVVSSGTLVSQTSDTITADGTYDTTLINSVTVSVGGGTPTSGAFYQEFTTGNETSRLSVAIIGTKGNSGQICVAYNGIVNSNPFDSFTPTNFNLSDYLSDTKQLTVLGRYSSSTSYQFKLTLNPANNTVTFSSISGQTVPTAIGTKSTSFTSFSVL